MTLSDDDVKQVLAFLRQWYVSHYLNEDGVELDAYKADRNLMFLCHDLFPELPR